LRLEIKPAGSKELTSTTFIPEEAGEIFFSPASFSSLTTPGPKQNRFHIYLKGNMLKILK
jgi:hypothetical protein